MKTLLTSMFFICSAFLIPSCSNTERSENIHMVRQSDFEAVINNKAIKVFTLKNPSGCVAQFTNYGARWISMWVPDKNGKMTDVVLGFSSIKGYLSAREQYHGAIIGRICGRIDDAEFTLDGHKYQLAANDLFGVPGKNHLHGGLKGFNKQVWDGAEFINEKGEKGISFNYFSEDGEEGFPGNLKVEIKYTLTEGNELTIEYSAVTDKKTIVNLTNHAYFNLNGEGNGNILDHFLKIPAVKYVECDPELIPTGNLREVERSPLDFREFSRMGGGINDIHDQIFRGKGYAAAMALKEKNDSEIIKIATAYSDSSGIMLEVFSGKPCLQIYNAWLFDGSDTGKSGKPYLFSGGFVLEPQGYPDPLRHENFPQIVLNPGEKYFHKDIYRFSVRKNQ